MTANIASALWTTEVREICNHLWQSTLFAGVIAALALLLRKNQARTRYWLWMTASAKFLIPLSLLVSLGSYLPRPNHLAASKVSTYIAIDEMSQPFSKAPIEDVPLVLSTPHTSVASSSTDRPSLLLTVVWLAGAITMACFWSLQVWRISRAVQVAEPLLEGREVELLRKLELAARLQRPIRLLRSVSSMEPGVFGIFRPALLWPEGISLHLDDAHLESVLAHEAFHVQRYDNFTSAIHMVVETVFWFHPLVWWMEGQLVKERERACDEQVLLVCGQPRVYAESLLKVCEYCVESSLSCVSGITGANLKMRVMQIMAGSIALQLNLRRKALLFVAALATIAVPIVLAQARVAQAISALDLKAAALEAAPYAIFEPSDNRLLRTPKEVRFASLESQLQPAPSMPKSSNAPVEAPKEPDWQTLAGSKMEFEVASIRPTKSGEFTPPLFPISNDNSYTAGPNDSFIADFSLVTYIEFAYKLRLAPDQLKAMLASVPKWVSSDNFEIRAKANGPVTKDQLRLMMQSLLASRFKLIVHLENRDAPVLALTLAKPGKLGPNLRPHSQGLPCDQHDDKTFPGSCYSDTLRRTSDGLLEEGSRNNSMDAIALILTSAGRLDHPVINETGLIGDYDFAIEWSPAANTGSASPDSQGASFLEALQEQLGVKIVSAHAPLQFLVIDHVERPSDN